MPIWLKADIFSKKPMMNLSPSLACKLLFRFSIVCLSWFTLLSCSSAPTQYGQSSTTVAQASSGESATKADSIYETYKPTKSELPEELKGTDTSDDNQDEIGIIASLKPASHYDFSSETKQVFINWVNADTDGNRLDTIKEYYDYLYTNAGYVPPMEQLLRSARSWLMCGFEPYGIPPKEYWESMLGTVKLLKYLIEAVIYHKTLSWFRFIEIKNSTDVQKEVKEVSILLMLQLI